MNQFNIKKRVTIDLNEISGFISMSLTEDSSTSVTMSSGSTVSTGSPDGGGNVSTSCVSFEGKTVDEGEMYYPYGHDACQVRQPLGETTMPNFILLAFVSFIFEHCLAFLLY